MTSRYVITLTDDNAKVLEAWLGFQLQIVPGGAPAGIPVAGLDAITEDEFAPINDRLASGVPPVYHHGGPAMSHMHEIRLPPELAAQLARPSELPEYVAYRRAMRDTEIAERELVLAWSMIYCTCPRRYTAGPPEQASCLVHGEFMTTWDGRTL